MHEYTYFNPPSNDAAKPREDDFLKSLPLDLCNDPGALFRKGEASKCDGKTTKKMSSIKNHFSSIL